MEVKRENIDYDHQVGKLVTLICLKLADGNGMMLKAKAELYADIMNGIDKLIEAKIAEFAIRYGDEVIKFAHNNIEEDFRDIGKPIRFVSSKEIRNKLLEKAFQNSD